MSASFYFSGDCNDEEVQLSIKTTFVNTLKNPMAFPPTFCLLQAKCNVANVVIDCGETTVARRRQRRGDQKEVCIFELCGHNNCKRKIQEKLILLAVMTADFE